MRKSLLLALACSLVGLSTASAIAAPPPVQRIPRPVVDVHLATKYSADALKRHITAAMPVFNTADLKMPALVNLDFRTKLGKERVLRRLYGRRWQVQHNRYFAGRVSEVSYELVVVNG